MEVPAPNSSPSSSPNSERRRRGSDPDPYAANDVDIRTPPQSPRPRRQLFDDPAKPPGCTSTHKKLLAIMVVFLLAIALMTGVTLYPAAEPMPKLTVAAPAGCSSARDPAYFTPFEWASTQCNHTTRKDAYAVRKAAAKVSGCSLCTKLCPETTAVCAPGSLNKGADSAPVLAMMAAAWCARGQKKSTKDAVRSMVEAAALVERWKHRDTPEGVALTLLAMLGFNTTEECAAAIKRDGAWEGK